MTSIPPKNQPPGEDSVPTVVVTSRGAGRLRAGHLWVYRSDLARDADAPAGSLVHVRDERGRRLGSALYSSAWRTAIRLRPGHTIADTQLSPLIADRIAAPVRFRQQNAGDTDAYRVVFS